MVRFDPTLSAWVDRAKKYRSGEVVLSEAMREGFRRAGIDAEGKIADLEAGAGGHAVVSLISLVRSPHLAQTMII